MIESDTETGEEEEKLQRKKRRLWTAETLRSPKTSAMLFPDRMFGCSTEPSSEPLKPLLVERLWSQTVR